MQTYIYRSEKKADCYIYLAKPKEAFELPAAVTKILGDLTLVMEIDIHEGSKLAQVKPQQVLESMQQQGFYIQMPSKQPHPVDALFERLFSENPS